MQQMKVGLQAFLTATAMAMVHTAIWDTTVIGSRQPSTHLQTRWNGTSALTIVLSTVPTTIRLKVLVCAV